MARDPTAGMRQCGRRSSRAGTPLEAGATDACAPCWHLLARDAADADRRPHLRLVLHARGGRRLQVAVGSTPHAASGMCHSRERSTGACLVNAGCVDVSVPGTQRPGDGIARLLAARPERAEAHRRQGQAAGQRDVGRQRHALRAPKAVGAGHRIGGRKGRNGGLELARCCRQPPPAAAAAKQSRPPVPK